MKKEYNIIYKFSDVMDVIEAESKEEAQKLADARIESEENPHQDTKCYEVEVEDVEE